MGFLCARYLFVWKLYYGRGMRRFTYLLKQGLQLDREINTCALAV